MSDIDLSNTDLDFLDTDIPIKHFQYTAWSRLEDMSWRRFEDMFSRRLQDVFSVTFFCLPRRFQNVFKTSSRRLPRRLEDVFKTSWKTKNCYAEDVLKTCLEDVFKTSWRPRNVCSDVPFLFSVLIIRLKSRGYRILHLQIVFLNRKKTTVKYASWREKKNLN